MLGPDGPSGSTSSPGRFPLGDVVDVVVGPVAVGVERGQLLFEGRLGELGLAHCGGQRIDLVLFGRELGAAQPLAGVAGVVQTGRDRRGLLRKAREVYLGVLGSNCGRRRAGAGTWG